MTDEQVRSNLWFAAVNLEFFRLQIGYFEKFEAGLRLILTIGTLAGISPIIKGLQDGVVSTLSWVSIGCGVFGLVGLPMFGISRRIELLKEWYSKWVDIRQYYLEALQASDNKRSARFKLGKEIAVLLQKDTRRFGLAFEKRNLNRAEEMAENWFRAMMLA